MAYTPIFTVTDKILRAIAEIECARGFLKGATMDERWVRRMSERALLLEAHHTTHIEGTHLTIDQSAEVWAGREVTANKDDIKELLNYRNAFEFISEYVVAGYPITEGVIREIHRRLVSGVRGDRAAPGEWRLLQNCVANSKTGEIVYMPPPPSDVPALMREFVEWMQATEINPIILSGVAQYQLVFIHPFIDGNGRTSRLLSTLLLYKSGYDFKRLFTISEFYDRDRFAFYSAIRSVEKNNLDLTGWLEFFTAGLAEQLGEVVKRGENAIKSSVIAFRHGMNARLAEVIAEFLEKKTVLTSDLEKLLPDIGRRTIQRDLKKLEEKGMIRLVGESRKMHYEWIFEEKNAG
ncbi:MAG: Fic family protein [Myxococcales bacterium]|jgi:Fic family protein|nr:Fic family protein [Myxococcales bacterium]